MHDCPRLDWKQHARIHSLSLAVLRSLGLSAAGFQLSRVAPSSKVSTFYFSDVGSVEITCAWSESARGSLCEHAYCKKGVDVRTTVVGFSHSHRSLSWRAWAGLLVKAVEGTLLCQTRLLLNKATPVSYHTTAHTLWPLAIQSSIMSFSYSKQLNYIVEVLLWTLSIHSNQSQRTD